MHCELKNMAEAMEAITQALMIEPQNSELIALQKEIKVIDKEIKDELAVNSAAVDNPAKNEPLSLSRRLDNFREQIAKLNETIPTILKATIWRDMEIEKRLSELSKDVFGFQSITTVLAVRHQFHHEFRRCFHLNEIGDFFGGSSSIYGFPRSIILGV